MRGPTFIWCWLALVGTLSAAETPRSGVQDVDALLKSLRSPDVNNREIPFRIAQGSHQIAHPPQVELIWCIAECFLQRLKSTKRYK